VRFDPVDIQTISSEEQAKTLFDEWRALQLRVGRSLFTDPAFFAAWWDTHGRGSGRRLHVTIGRDQGRLVALAPLVVVRRFGFRFIEWAGANVFDYSDTLLDDHAGGEPLWRAIRSSRQYDVAFIRDVHAGLDCYNALTRFGHPARRTTIYRVDIAWASGEAWMAEALSRSGWQLLRRKQRQIQRQGEFGFRVHRSGPVPLTVLDALIRQKAAWASRRGEPGLFDDPPRAASLLLRMAEAAEQLGSLHLSWLHCDEEILAVHLGFMHRNVLHYYMPSYDENWGRHSPGSLLIVHLIRWCVENRVGTLDFMRGNDSYKSAFANARIELTAFSFPGSPKGRLAEWIVRKVYLKRSRGSSTMLSQRAGKSGTRPHRQRPDTEARPTGRKVAGIPDKGDKSGDRARC
jgi:CelD/BcsL family acetyltransferase involved in cellulose biosynthesis